MKKANQLERSQLFLDNAQTIKDQIKIFNHSMKQAELITKENGIYSPEFMLTYEEFFLQEFEKTDPFHFRLLNEVLVDVKNALMYKVTELCNEITTSRNENFLNFQNIESKISAIISTYKYEVGIIFEIEIPNFLINPFIQEIEEKVKSNYKLHVSAIISHDNNETYWKKKCDSFLSMIYNKEIQLFDQKMIVSDHFNIINCILSMIQNSKTSFNNLNYYDFVELNINLIQILDFPQNKKEELIHMFINYGSDHTNKQYRKEKCKKASDNYHTLVDNLNGDIRMFILFCVLLCLSNAFQNGKIVSTNYPPINREIARKFLTRLAKFDIKSKKFYNFYKLIAFEGQLGEFLESKKDIQKIIKTDLPAQFLNYSKFSSLNLLRELIKLHNKINLNKKIFEMMNPEMKFDPDNINNPRFKMFVNLLTLLKYNELFSIERISANNTSKSAIYCISGFLSQGQNEEKSWKAVVDLFPDSQVFAIKYSSTKVIDLIKGTIKDLTLHFYKALLIPFGLIFPRLLPEITLTKQFDIARKNAHVTGKLLAICIALGIHLENQSITLIAFSLGTKVVTSCVHYLHKLHAHNKVHDIILMGGAASIDKKLSKFRSYFQVANGKVMNCYSKNDTILKVLAHYKNITPIGTCPVVCYSKSSAEKEIIDNGKVIKNICMTKLATGHLVYRSKLINIVSTIFNKYYFKFLSFF